MQRISWPYRNQSGWREFHHLGIFRLKWMTYERARQEQFRAMLADENDREVFGDEFLKTLAQTKLEREKIWTRLWLLQMVLLAFLAISVVPIQTDISLFGLSARSTDKLKEVVLFISAVIGVFGSLFYGDVIELRAALEALMENRALGRAAEIVRLPYLPYLLRGFFTFPISPRRGIVLAASTFVCLMTAMALLLLIILTFLLLAYVIHIYVLLDVAKNPGLPWHWSWVVIVFTIVCDVYGVLILMLTTLPLPFRDYTGYRALVELERTDPTAYSNKIQEIVDGAMRRRWYRWLYGWRKRRKALLTRLKEWRVS